MPLFMLDQNPESLPVIYCDACGQPIESVTEGNYHWGAEPFDRDHPVVKQVIYFSHKSECCRIVDQKFKTPCAMDLDDLLLLLIKTLKFDRKKAQATQSLIRLLKES
jgi:hypothetical protein